MPVYLSPGVFPREIDLSVLPSSVGPLRPAFIGTAQKGPMNIPTLVTTSQQAIDSFGSPFPESYLMYAVLSYLEEGNACYILRVGVECEEGQAQALADVCIDTSGAHGNGWGRIPLFTGIDYGRINFRTISDSAPLAIHAASVGNITYNDVDASNTFGATSATLNTTGTYTGDIDDSFVMVITSPPTVSAEAAVDGAGYQIIRNSDGEIVAEGTLVDDNDDGISAYISLGNGLSVRVNVSAGVLDENDTFTFTVLPDNRAFTIAVEGVSGSTYTLSAATYTTVASFVAALNLAITGGGEDYLFLEYTLEDGVTTVPQIRTTTAGERVQLIGTAAFALAVGTQQYAYDIPRSFLIGTDVAPYDITTANNRVKINVIEDTATATVEFNVAIGNNQSAASVAASIDAAGIVSGTTYWESFVLTIPGETEHVVIVTHADHELATLQMVANYSNLKTLRFAETLNIGYPYKRAYRGFNDNRLTLPDSGENDAATPLSCESDPTSAACAADTSYFANIVGYFVAPSPGTWIDGYTVSLDIFTDAVGDAAGRYRITVKDSSGVAVDIVEDVSFDKREDRYVGNVINAGTKYGGTNGNVFLNWEERPSYLNNNTNSASFEVRLPSQINDKAFAGQANGIPTDPSYSSELDAAIIGNPSLNTGIYAFQNPESYDINLLLTPGFSTGSVIGTALQMCESRGDVLYLVDPPFGLRPQQVIDWHNGMLLSDLRSAINSSYGALYWGWLRVYDQFRNEEIWVPPSGHVAAVYSRTARDAEQWFAPAGLRRGRLLTALDIEYSPTQGERDLLYGSGNAVNPIVKFPQDGITVWGQRTLQRSSTALDRVNVRMLMLYIKKNLVTLLRNYIFEPNDKALWRQVKSTVNPFLSDIQSRRGLTAFNVVCDESNNTPERIDRNELWVSVFLKPTRAVEFIALNLVVLRTGASFSAEEVLAAGGVVTGATAV